MSIQDLGAIGEFVSSIFIVVTFVYLIIQMRQNTLSIRSQSRYFVLESLNADMRQVQSLDYQELVSKIIRNEASAADKSRWEMTLTAFLSHLEMLYFEVDEGALQQEFSETLQVRVASALRQADADRIWQTYRVLYTRSFQQYVDTVAAQDIESIIGEDFTVATRHHQESR